MSKAQKLSDPEIVASVPDHCGCLKLPGQVGNHGWHWWIVTREYLETVQKMRWRAENPLLDHRLFQYNSAEEIYLGHLHAAERCPAYVAATTRAGGEAGHDNRRQGGRR